MTRVQAALAGVSDPIRVGAASLRQLFTEQRGPRLRIVEIQRLGRAAAEREHAEAAVVLELGAADPNGVRAKPGRPLDSGHQLGRRLERRVEMRPPHLEPLRRGPRDAKHELRDHDTRERACDAERDAGQPLPNRMRRHPRPIGSFRVRLKFSRAGLRSAGGIRRPSTRRPCSAARGARAPRSPDRPRRRRRPVRGDPARSRDLARDARRSDRAGARNNSLFPARKAD